MATGIGGFIDRLQVGSNGSIIAIGSSAYGACSNSSNEANKTALLPDFVLREGTTVHIKFTNGNSASNPTLNIEGTGAKALLASDGTALSNIEAGSILTLTYDGTNWINTWSAPSSDEQTAQTGVTDNQDLSILLKYTNNLNDEINGTKFVKTSANVATINPYNGIMKIKGLEVTNTISGDINGNAATVNNLTVQTAVPANAVFTDTTYSAAQNGGLTLNTADHEFSIAPGGVTNAMLANSSITLSNVTVPLGGSLDLSSLLGSLDISGALRFIGVLTNNSTSPTDGGNETVTVTNVSNYTPASGDVVVTNDQMHEFLWANGQWCLLGFTSSTVYDSTSISATSNDVPTWIAGLTQSTDGTVRVTKETLGILPVAHGGTGNDSFIDDQVILSTVSNNVTSFTSRAYSDSNAAGALLSNSTNFVTERDVYYGLPFINNVHNYTSSDTLFAPITSGTQYQLLVSNGTGSAPVWTAAALLNSVVSDVADAIAETTLTLGNGTAKSSASNHSEGKIILYSAGTNAHVISGAADNTNEYEHILPNVEGYFLQATTLNAIGSNTQPIYIAANGIATALTYTPNRLYYSDAAAAGQLNSTDFIAGNHYASNDKIAINSTNAPTENLYVNGTTYIGSGVGIGVAPETITSAADYHIFTIKGSTLIMGAHDNVAHLDIIRPSGSSSDLLKFIPANDTYGYFGELNYRWNHMYLSNFLNIVSNSSSILLSTVDGNNDIGVITITTSVPTIEFNSTANNSIDWEITNDGEVFSINNQGTSSSLVEIEGQEDGFKITGGVGIGTDPEIINNNNNYHILTINGSTSIISGQYNAAYLEVLSQVINSTSVYSTQFYPEVPESGYIGLDINRWRGGYFSHLLEVGTRTNDVYTGVSLDGDGAMTIVNGYRSIEFDTPAVGSLEESKIDIISNDSAIHLLSSLSNSGSAASITIDADAPQIILNTLSLNVSDWLIINDEGIFSINNQASPTLIQLQGTDDGFSLTNRLYINDDIPQLPEYALYVNGDSGFDGNLLPNIDDTYTLGRAEESNIEALRWASLFIGTADTYGDPYLPVYWNQGVPAYTNGIVQKKNFSFASGATSTTIEHEAYNQLYGIETFVLQIVVTSGESNLNSLISWESHQKNGSTTIGEITLTTSVATSGIVSGYILTARGIDLDAQSQPVTPVDPGNNEDPNSEPGNNEDPGNGEEPGNGEDPNSNSENNEDPNSGSENNEDPGSGSENNEEPPT